MRIKELREKNGISQVQLADRMGVDPAAVHRWETGAATPRTGRLPELADVFHCTIDELYGRDPPDYGLDRLQEEPQAARQNSA